MAGEVVGYLIRWNHYAWRGPTSVSADPCHEDDGTSEPLVLASDYEALLAERDALRKDAERYRWLRDLTPNALHLSRNGDHACNYMTARQWIEEDSTGWFDDDAPEELARMKATDTIWTLQIYPNTPVGFSKWNAATLDAAIDAAIAGSGE